MCFSDLDAEAKEKEKLTPEKKGMKWFLNCSFSVYSNNK